jgi:ADP-ribose pyrophosphatase
MNYLEEKTTSSKSIYDGRILHMFVDEVELPDGSSAEREIVRHPGGACVAALDSENNLYFVRQFRYPYKEVVLELPAGKLEKGSTPLENAKRELKEETGCTGYSFISLGQLYPSTGYTDEIIHLYACRVESVGEQEPDDDEFIKTERIPFNKALEMVLNNQLPDAKTQTAILKLDALLRNSKQ